MKSRGSPRAAPVAVVTHDLKDTGFGDDVGLGLHAMVECSKPKRARPCSRSQDLQ